jgi:hypothetical protein
MQGQTIVKNPARSRALALLAAVSGLAVALPAMAQEAQFDFGASREGLFVRNRTVSVRERPHPEYAPVPKKAGAFIVAPVLTGLLEYNDNIFATSSNEQSDVIMHLLPSVTVRSDWSRNAAALFARADVAGYADNDSENTTTWIAGGVGRYDVKRGASLQSGASYASQIESRTSSGSLTGADGPQEYEEGKAFVGGTYTFNRLRVLGQLNYSGLRFDNIKVGGLSVDRSFRDRDALALQGRAEYGLTPATALFFDLTGNKRESTGSTVGIVNRNSEGVEALVGANFDLGGLARGEASIGYLKQNYEGALYSDVKGASVHAKLDYFPTQLLTLSLTVDRSVEDAAIINSSGYLATSVQMRADYELLRNLILSGTFNYGNDDFKGIDRTDKRATAGVTANWLLNRSLAAVFSYQFADQNSSGANQGRDYTSNRLAVGLSHRF